MCFYYEELFNSCAIVMLNVKCIKNSLRSAGARGWHASCTSELGPGHGLGSLSVPSVLLKGTELFSMS